MTGPKQTGLARTMRAEMCLQLRFVTGAFMGLAIGALVAGAALAEEGLVKSHGYSFFGELSYPADYTHFNYVNPDAPKGGEI